LDFTQIDTSVISMSDAGDDIQVDNAPEAEVAVEAPKGKLSIEDALQVCGSGKPEFRLTEVCSKF
jgi:hypothetical protein